VDADVETSPETAFDQPAAPESPASTEVEPSVVASDPSPLDKDEFGSIDAAMAAREPATSDLGASSDTSSDATASEVPLTFQVLRIRQMMGISIPVTVASSQNDMSGPEVPETPEVGGMDQADQPFDAMDAAVPAAAAMPSESFPAAAPLSSPEAAPGECHGPAGGYSCEPSLRVHLIGSRVLLRLLANRLHHCNRPCSLIR
jgi:hypothetical protein